MTVLPGTPIRHVKVWRNLAKDEKFLITVATCKRCGQDFELKGGQASRKALAGSYIFFLAMITLLLSLLDGYFSLQLMDLGARELNPFLSRLAGFGPTVFLVAKYGLTSLGVILLVLYHDRAFFFGRITGRHILLGALIIFSAAIYYQAMLLWAGGNDNLALAHLSSVVGG